MRPNETHSASAITSRSVVEEGVLAGASAASGVALGFLAADAARGVPLETPALLGRGVASVLGVGSVAASSTLAIVGYTVLHYAAFALLGVLAAAVLRVARRQATVLAGALLVFAIAEVAFAGLVAVLHATTMTGTLAWAQLVGGNVVGCALLALALHRQHPELHGELDVAVRGTGAWAVR